MLEAANREKKKNTETFKPSHDPSEMRILFSAGVSKYSRQIQTRDVIFVPDLFCEAGDLSVYHRLHSELADSGLTPHQIWSSWHGDSHLTGLSGPATAPPSIWCWTRSGTTSIWTSPPPVSTGTETAQSGNLSITTLRPSRKTKRASQT